MFKKLISRLSLACVLLGATASLAEGDHPHDKGPHGGDVRGFGKYHMEGVKQGEKATFYLLGDDGKTAATIAKHEGGTITIIAPGKAQEKTAIAAGNNFSETSVNVPAAGKITVLVSIKEGGKNTSTKFSFSK